VTGLETVLGPETADRGVQPDKHVDYEHDTVTGLETVLGPETELIEVYSLTNTSIMQTSYFWTVVWNISVSSDVLRTFEFPNCLN
jgi:hypothetical protein